MTTKQRLILNFMGWLAVVAICSLVGCGGEPGSPEPVLMPANLELSAVAVDGWTSGAPATLVRNGDGLSDGSVYFGEGEATLVRHVAGCKLSLTKSTFECPNQPRTHCPTAPDFQVQSGFVMSAPFVKREAVLSLAGDSLVCAYDVTGKVSWVTLAD